MPYLVGDQKVQGGMFQEGKSQRKAESASIQCGPVGLKLPSKLKSLDGFGKALQDATLPSASAAALNEQHEQRSTKRARSRLAVVSEHARKQQEGALVLADALHALGSRAGFALRHSINNGAFLPEPFWPSQASRTRPIFGRFSPGQSVSPAQCEGSLADELSKLLRNTCSVCKHKRRWQQPLNRGAQRKERFSRSSDALFTAGEPRDVAVITTASLPWMTGTAVNPLLRAAYLSLRQECSVTLLIPFLPPSDQSAVHANTIFSHPKQQEAYVRNWMARRVGFEPDIEMRFYPGRYARDKCSIVPVGDITQCIPESRADIAVLEEPEHLTWYHHGTRWTQKFNCVVGVVHTNYLEYVKREHNGLMKERALRTINQWVCRAYCDKVVKLSDAVQPLPRASTSWVHGVSPRFIDIGVQKSKEQAAHLSFLGTQQEDDANTSSTTQPFLTKPGRGGSTPAETRAINPFPRGVYFIGKTVWAKGYSELLDMLEYHKNSTGSRNLQVDVYGDGEDFEAIQSRAAEKGLQLSFFGSRDHADETLQEYKVFVNPSLSDVVATTTAEALAMGKFVVVADHPSNAFFTQFNNCLTYSGPQEFTQAIELATTSEPQPLSSEEQTKLTWEAATERFLSIASESAARNPMTRGMDWALGQTHTALTGIPFVRYVAGAGPDTLYAPDSWEWDPNGWTGGIFDRNLSVKVGGYDCPLRECTQLPEAMLTECVEVDVSLYRVERVG